MSDRDTNTPDKYMEKMKVASPIEDGVDESSSATPTKPGTFFPSDVQQASLNAGAAARAARDSFVHAMSLYEKGDIESADAAFSETKDRTQELWSMAGARSQAFKALLAAIDAATRYLSVSEFSQAQLNCLSAAYGDLPKSYLEQDDVTRHIRNFAMAGVDITGPIRSRKNVSVSITVQTAE